MGQKVILTCDLHNDNTEATETVRFSVGRDTYELELCDKHLKDFNDKLAPFVNGGRHVSGTRASQGTRKAAVAGRRPGRGRRSSPRSVDVVSVREWARENGYDVSSRGRIPGAILDAYHSNGQG
jgi:hypothetical protein